MTSERWSTIERLYHEALACGADERAAFLSEACAGDDALMSEVESLLAHDGDAAFLSTPMAMVDAGRTLVGHRVGLYEISGRIGEGGMGEVYRARDTKLSRDVAIKVLPRVFTSDQERLARFEREARMLAALNHPHIGAIYGLESFDGTPALVLELVEGETLAVRIAKGPLPVTDALPIATQIAEALEAAHDKGIIHRDLKPANITITPKGVVKVLDFGLAKLEAGRPGGATVAPAMTIGTHEGMILGTAAYMSPEQARGHAVDKRTDIWAFGCVLYEMLTGQAVFARETITDTLAAIVDRDPDWTGLPANTPPAVRRLLQRCLDKDPQQRLRDIGDARVELEQLAAAPPRHSRPWYRAVGPIGLVLLILAVGAGLFYSARPPGPVTSPSEYAQITNFTDSATAPSLSPDGRMVTFKRGDDAFLSSGQIYVKLLPNGESVRLTNDAHRKFGPVFTPDGSRIAYTQVASSADWDTWTVPVLGGQPTRLLPNASGLTWLADRRVLFSEIMGTGFHMGIVTATEGRADSREIYFPPHQLGMAHYSYPSPDRQSILVVEMNQTHKFTQPCRLIPFDGSTAGRQVGPQGPCTSTAWSPDGRWMYFGARVRGSAHLWRQKFPDGVPEQITFGPLEEEDIALAADGRSLVTSVGTRRSAIWIHDAAGERAISSEGYVASPRLSRDGTRAFYLTVQDLVASAAGWVSASAELRTVDVGSGKTDSVLPGVLVTDYDISRDEKEVAFTTTDSNGESQIWLASLDRRTPPRQIARGGDEVSFGADGDLIFRSLEGTTDVLVRIKKDGSGRERMTTTPILNKYSVSPDGNWVIVFSIAGDAVGETLAVPIHGGTSRKVCAGVGSQCRAAWSSDGRFFYVAADKNVSATSPGKTLAIPVPAGKSLPDLPASGIYSAAGEVELPGALVIGHGSMSPGPDPSTYVFTNTDLQRNLFRIPLH